MMLTPEQITSLVTVMVWGSIFGLSMLVGLKMIVRGTKIKRVRLDKPLWWLYSLIIGGSITGLIWYVCTVYFASSPIDTLITAISGWF